jgi:arylsulfatase A-like enzyme
VRRRGWRELPAQLISDSALRRIGSALAVAWLACGFGCGREPAAERPHLLLVTIDTLRVDHIGAYSADSTLTPHLDGLAASSLVYEAAFTTMPTTAPAHTSLFTGLHPFEHGVVSNGLSMPPDVAATRSLPARLREAGYATGAFLSSQAFGPELMGLRGFDVVRRPPQASRPGGLAVDEVLAWLDEVGERPVFLWVHLFDPHSPYGTQAEKLAGFPVDPAAYGWVERSRYDDAAQRELMVEQYGRGVRDADAVLGRLLEGVRGRLEPAPTVVATADHGEFLAELLDSHGFAFGHGSVLDQAVLQIPILLSGPGIEPGRVSGTASIRDLYTTLLEAAGLGDEDARREGRRDLLVPFSERRLVSAELRRVDTKVQARSGQAQEKLQVIRNNAVAIMDGTGMVVLSEDGAVRPDGTSASPDLVEAARRRLEARQLGATLTSEPLDDETRRMLESLGYLR